MAVTQQNFNIAAFTEEVHQVYQQTTTKLRGAVREHKGVIGSTYQFKVLGKGIAVQKERFARFVPPETVHSTVTATLEDWYDVEYVGDLDQLKTNADLRKEYAVLVASALNRKLDSIIITAASAGSNLITTTAGGWTYAKHTEAFNKLNAADVDEADRFMVVGPEALGAMMNEAKVISGDYTGALLPAMSGKIGHFMGFSVIVSNLLPRASNVETCLYFNKKAIGLAIGQELNTKVERVATMDATQILAKISAGAVIIDPTGVVEMPVAV